MPKKVSFWKSREFWLPTLGALGLGLAAFNAVAFSYDESFTKALYGDGIDFDAPEEQKARADAAVFAGQMEEESIALLKNEYHTLPLSSPRVNVFGYGSSSRGFIHQGGGSGKTSDFGLTSLYDSLTHAGLELNPELVSFYEGLRTIRSDDTGSPDRYFRNLEVDPSRYPYNFFERAKAFSSTALIVLSRPATEKLDIPVVSYTRLGEVIEDTPTLSLSSEERYLIEHVTDYFDRVAIILNSGSPMEVPFADDENIGAILNVGFPGNTGCEAIGKVLLGKVNPSGHTVDTFAKSHLTNPSYYNSSTYGDHAYNEGARYVDYAESIYVGYRFYETWFEESGRNESLYNSFVAYPFGHGLSYTNFTWDILDAEYVNQKGETTPIGSSFVPSEDGTFRFSVWVENVGNVAGKDVVELYSSVPYFRGKIEKSTANLVAFSKTSSLKPGHGELVKLEVPLRQLSSYDCYDANDNGFVGYELDAGSYALSFRKNAHVDHPLIGRADSSFRFSLAHGMAYGKDEVTGNNVTNLFTTMSNPVSGASSTIDEPLSYYALSIDGGTVENINYFSRKDFVSTFPKLTETRPYKEEVARTLGVRGPAMEEHKMPRFGIDHGRTIADSFGKPYEDPIYDELVEQCSVEELTDLFMHAGFRTAPLDSIGKPRCLDLDGPSGINTSVLSSSPGNAASYPSPSTYAQSWNVELCYEYGRCVAAEAKALGINGWYAPGTNIHRCPTSGRNFEYFSEDPFLSGMLSSYVITGARHGGLYAYVKHFAADENESGTNGQYHYLTEQALREIFAKPFEIAVKVGKASAIMLSKNRIGTVRAAGSRALIEGLLRKEWGFQGSVITDYYVPGNVMNADEALRAGVDLILEGNTVYLTDMESTTFHHYLAKAARNVIYCYSSTMAAANQAQDLPIDHMTGAKNEVRPYWKPILIVTDALVFPGIIAAIILAVKKFQPASDPDAS